MEITVRVFKNRTLVVPSELECERHWENPMFWTCLKGPLERRVGYDAKYEGYEVWELPLDQAQVGCNVMPCKALVMCSLRDGLVRLGLYAFSTEYVTVQAALPAPAYGPWVMLTMEAHAQVPGGADVGALKPTIWLQNHAPQTRFLLKLQKNTNFDTVVCRDDRTGEAYPYVISRVLVLRRH